VTHLSAKSERYSVHSPKFGALADGGGAAFEALGVAGIAARRLLAGLPGFGCDTPSRGSAGISRISSGTWSSTSVLTVESARGSGR